MSDDQYWLFYHPDCKHCVDFINKAQENAGLVKKINMVDIGQNKDRLPKWLDRIPALNTGDKIYKGAELFDWLKGQVVKLEIDAAPMMNSKGGFAPNPFTSLNNETVHPNFSEIGTMNGSEGVNTDKAQNQHNAELKDIEASRAADIRSVM